MFSTKPIARTQKKHPSKNIKHRFPTDNEQLSYTTCWYNPLYSPTNKGFDHSSVSIKRLFFCWGLGGVSRLKLHELQVLNPTLNSKLFNKMMMKNYAETPHSSKWEINVNHGIHVQNTFCACVHIYCCIWILSILYFIPTMYEIIETRKSRKSIHFSSKALFREFPRKLWTDAS